MKIEGSEVTAIDSQQSSIISRLVLHQIGKHLRAQGKPVPKLQPASMRLDGTAGKHVTAQVTLTVEADGVSVPVLLFIQPDSTQPCLIGMNADWHECSTRVRSVISEYANGQPSRKTAITAKSLTVSLILSKSAPARAFVEAAELMEGACVLFDEEGSFI